MRSGIDLSLPRYYFVTILTKYKKHLLGELREAEVKLSSIGAIADRCLRKIPEIYPFTGLEGHIIMPDHLHCVIEIKKGADFTKSLSHILQFYKRQVTLEMRKTIEQPPDILWGRSFWARAFSRVDELCAYQKYMIENPLKASLSRQKIAS